MGHDQMPGAGAADHLDGKQMFPRTLGRCLEKTRHSVDHRRRRSPAQGRQIGDGLPSDLRSLLTPSPKTPPGTVPGTSARATSQRWQTPLGRMLPTTPPPGPRGNLSPCGRDCWQELLNAYHSGLSLVRDLPCKAMPILSFSPVRTPRHNRCPHPAGDRADAGVAHTSDGGRGDQQAGRPRRCCQVAGYARRVSRIRYRL